MMILTKLAMTKVLVSITREGLGSGLDSRFLTTCHASQLGFNQGDDDAHHHHHHDDNDDDDDDDGDGYDDDNNAEDDDDERRVILAGRTSTGE